MPGRRGSYASGLASICIDKCNAARSNRRPTRMNSGLVKSAGGPPPVGQSHACIHPLVDADALQNGVDVLEKSRLGRVKARIELYRRLEGQVVARDKRPYPGGKIGRCGDDPGPDGLVGPAVFQLNGCVNRPIGNVVMPPRVVGEARRWTRKERGRMPAPA
jgi:hypothetical protein